METRRTRRSGGSTVPPSKAKAEEVTEEEKTVDPVEAENQKTTEEIPNSESETVNTEEQQVPEEEEQPMEEEEEEQEEEEQEEEEVSQENDAEIQESDTKVVCQKEDAAVEEERETIEMETKDVDMEEKKDNTEEGVTETKGQKRPRERKESYRSEDPNIELKDIPSLNEEEMRQKWKWSIRVFPISPDDATYSGLSVMPKVQDSVVHFSRRDPDKGQMELCMQNTGDAMMMMVHVLRTPLTSRFITVELTKRAQRKLAKPSAGGNVESAELEEQSKIAVDDDKDAEEDDKEETKPEEEGTPKTKKGADEKLETNPSLATKNIRSKPNHPKVWPYVREKALFVVDLMRVQKIRFMRKTKGELKRRSVFVGNMSKGTTEELLKVIFPMANGILMKNTDDSDCRRMFIETCHRFNAIGFMQSYPLLKINDKAVKLTVEASDLEVLGEVEETEDAAEKQEGEEAAEGGGKKEGEGEGSEAESKKKGGKPQKDEEEGKRKQPANKTKKKRKRHLFDRMQREWNATLPQGPGRQGDARAPPVHARRGRGGGRGMGGSDRMRPVGQLMSGAPGLLGTAPVAPMMGQMEGKIAHLMRLQNQLEMTIHNQMSYIERAEAMGVLDQPLGGGGFGGGGGRDVGGGEFSMGTRDFGGHMGGGGSIGSSSSAGRRGGGRFGGGKGGGHIPNANRDRQRGNRNKRAAESNRRGGAGGSKNRFSSAGSPISSLVTSNPSKRFRRDSSGDRFGMRNKDTSRNTMSSSGGLGISNFAGSTFTGGAYGSGSFSMGSGSKYSGGKFGGSTGWGSGANSYGDMGDLGGASGFGLAGNLGGGSSYSSGGSYGSTSLGTYGSSSFGSGGGARGPDYDMDSFGAGRSWNTSYGQSQGSSGNSYGGLGGYGDGYNRY